MIEVKGEFQNELKLKNLTSVTFDKKLHHRLDSLVLVNSN